MFTSSSLSSKRVVGRLSSCILVMSKVQSSLMQTLLCFFSLSLLSIKTLKSSPKMFVEMGITVTPLKSTF
ncbi:hypothetical protein M947_07570 [Sulfurimonas hongkongensis]|uniref:Uncharacterized protein n=1 Tax=Sulfurimonas hongkongensis TaxID=1172190 RepID=T0KQN1_9BACT|nr:hypothetical protein M947_07570 [Sulfurimonas hongkongensis]